MWHTRLAVETAGLVVALLCAAAGSALAQSTGGNPKPATEADAVAIYRARLAEQQANNEANLAAVSVGYKQALTGAKQGSQDDQLKMVGNAVKNWKAPRGYAGAAALDASAIQDPFAVATPSLTEVSAVQAAIGKSGLVWDAERTTARVGPSATDLCGGRLQAGDYPTLQDGNLLDTPARVAQFLASCADRSRLVVVVLESGDVAVRK